MPHPTQQPATAHRQHHHVGHPASDGRNGGHLVHQGAVVLKLQPFTDLDSPLELIKSFGGRPQYLAAVQSLERELYACPFVAPFGVEFLFS